MPTGYTSYIENGEITTGKDFLTLCCRAFGICIDMKEDSLSKPIPEKFEPDGYYKERYDNALLALEKARNLTTEEALIKIKIDRENREKDIAKLIKKDEELKTKYLKVRGEVEKWTPPTFEYSELKKFALEQIDVSSRDYSEYYNEELKRIRMDILPEDYINDNIDVYVRSVQRAKSNYEAEIQRTNERNMWLKGFRDSF